jgi:hypothetical protein
VQAYDSPFDDEASFETMEKKTYSESKHYTIKKYIQFKFSCMLVIFESIFFFKDWKDAFSKFAMAGIDGMVCQVKAVDLRNPCNVFGN